MGILNVTPDSFSDGGLFCDRSRAVERAEQLVAEGADIIDIGGESTRPGSEAIPLDEELLRVIPVLQTIAPKLPVPISIDTYKADVARRALDAGASIVNDISGLRFDPSMPGIVAEYGVPVILMHIRGAPKDMQKDPVYDALIPEVMSYLRTSIRMAESAGIDPSRIIVDPGIGFGKTFSHNLEIINHLDLFKALQKPIAIGVSRKAFIGRVLGGLPPQDRIEGTAAAVSAAIMKGANIVRVHDVKEMTRVAKMVDAISRERLEP